MDTAKPRLKKEYLYEGHLTLYADDFKKFHIWEEVIQALGVSEASEVTVTICGVKSKGDKNG